MHKIINPCFVNIGLKYRRRVFIKIDIYTENRPGESKGELSITGTIPAYAWGQINMEFRSVNGSRIIFNECDIFYIEPWNKDLFNKLLDIWDNWHLRGDIPEDVINFLDSLPPTKVIPMNGV